MPVTDQNVPYQLVADELKEIIDDEFEEEGFVARHDKLHESLGRYRVDIGISPTRETGMIGNMSVMEQRVFVQFYDLWTDEIDPETQVNPYRITGFADRFRRAVEQHQNAFLGSPQVWYFDVDEVLYPDDPTGNKSRFEAYVRVHGDNNALNETTG